MSNEKKFVRLVSGHKAMSGVLILLAVLLIAYFSLMMASLRCDRSDPRARPNSYHSIETVVVDRSIEDVFRFIQRDIPAVYTRLSPLHGKFEILNADLLTPGAEVDCVEGDDRDIVRNRYVVTEVVENQSIAMSSTPTRVYSRESGQLTAEVDVDDHFDFQSLGPDRTKLTQTVVLEMENPFIKAFMDLIAFLAGTRDDWEQQFRDQNRNLARLAQEIR